MIPTGGEYYFLHDSEGRVLAVVQRASLRADEGIELGVRPDPFPGQGVVEGDLPDRVEDLPDLLETFDLRVDIATGQVTAQVRETAG